MDGFAIVAFGGGLAVVLVLLALGKWYPGSGADQVGWKPTRSVETEVALELEDIDQMIAAQNERRRRTGRAEIDEESVRAQVSASEREHRERQERYRREA